MRDAFFAEKISSTVVALCWKQKIGCIKELVVGVHPNSDLDEGQLAGLIFGKKPDLVNAGTRIRIVRDMAQENAAEIRSISGKPEGKV
jgi:hypothetical protein